MTVEFEDDTTGLEKLLDGHKVFKGKEAVVGVLGSKASAKHKGSDATNVIVASTHEFGSDTVPERSFLRQAMDTNKAKIAALLELAYASMLEGKDAEKELAKVGEKALSMVYEQFDKGGIPKWETLDPTTLLGRLAKISPAQNKEAASVGIARDTVKPLMDTGQLRQSIQTAVRKAGESK